MEVEQVLRKALESPTPRKYEDVKSIPKISGDISYYRFFMDFMLPNFPVIFDERITDTWKSRREWITRREGKEIPNFKVLKEKFGQSNVRVAHCAMQEYSDQKREEMSMEEFLDLWEASRSEEREKETIGMKSKEDVLYMKDWHMVREYPNEEAYETPEYFKDDWMNSWCDSMQSDDYRFVYMGCQGTWTPFHTDVFNWSANVCGKKLWLLYSPDQEPLFKVRQLSCLIHKDQFGNLIYDVEEVDHSRFPDFPKSRPLKCIQNSGEVMFVPSGWFHTVYNLEDTISINHNWGNGCNVDLFWSFLKNELKLVEHSIRDCKELCTSQEWTEQCQLLLRVNSGIDFKGFEDYVSTIAKEQLNILSGSLDHSPSTKEIQAVFNLLKLSDPLNEINSDQLEPLRTQLVHILQQTKRCWDLPFEVSKENT